MSYVYIAVAGTAVTIGAAQYAYGAYQDANNDRPTATIPPEIYNLLSQSQIDSLQGMNQSQKEEFYNNVKNSNAFALRENQSRNGGLQGVEALDQSNKDAYLGLAVQDNAIRQKNKQVYSQAQQVMADYRQQLFQTNELNPYYEKKAEAEALKGAGMQNISSGMTTGVGAMGGMGKSNTGNTGGSGSSNYGYGVSGDVNGNGVRNPNYVDNSFNPNLNDTPYYLRTQ